MGRRGAVKAAAGEDAVVLLQLVGGLGVVDGLEIDRNDAHPVLKLPGAGQADALHIPQPVQEPLRQLLFPPLHGVYTGTENKVYRCLEAVNARDIGGAGFKLVGHVVGLGFGVRGAAGATGGNGGEILGKIAGEEEGPDAGGTHETLVARHRQCGEVHGLEIHRIVAGGLSCIQHKGDAVLAADGSHCHRVLYGAADIGAMSHHQKAGVGFDHSGDVRRVQTASAVTGDAVKGNALLRQVVEGPHDCVVLHAADQAVISRAQPAPQYHIEPQRVAAGENAVGGVVVVEEAAQAFPQHQGGHAGGLGTAVYAPVDGSPHFRQVLEHGLCHGGGFGKGGGSVIQIDRVHSILLPLNISINICDFKWIFHGETEKKDQKPQIRKIPEFFTV